MVPVDSPFKGLVMKKACPCRDVIVDVYQTFVQPLAKSNETSVHRIYKIYLFLQIFLNISAYFFDFYQFPLSLVRQVYQRSFLRPVNHNNFSQVNSGTRLSKRISTSHTTPPTQWVWLDTLRPRKNGRHFADDVFKCIFLNENVWILLKISLKFVLKGPINNIPSLVQIMAWRRPGDKPLSEPMMVSLLTHICVARPQWVKTLIAKYSKNAC